ncbi:hypothetical protein EVAR_90330_1 [Eumeta japonica]|uniref:Uncharacterized protein n=1 Tax=Eumeta variegata TaxID=151549 RepID=A0A4C1YFK9_EUMVA|nr:hypothetical protein EVAR_90330_1 [Eumeta japonica]
MPKQSRAVVADGVKCDGPAYDADKKSTLEAGVSSPFQRLSAEFFNSIIQLRWFNALDASKGATPAMFSERRIDAGRRTGDFTVAPPRRQWPKTVYKIKMIKFFCVDERRLVPPKRPHEAETFNT